MAHFVTPILRDNENAYVSVNGKTCWSKTMNALDGTQQCGGFFKEEMFRVTGCYVTLPCVQEEGVRVRFKKWPVTVRVWTDLDGDAADESFAIRNVVIKEGIMKRIAVGQNSYFLTHPHPHPHAVPDTSTAPPPTKGAVFGTN